MGKNYPAWCLNGMDVVTRAASELPSVGTVRRGRLDRLDTSSCLPEQCWCPRLWTLAVVPSYFTGSPAQPAPRVGFGFKKSIFSPATQSQAKHPFSLSSLLPLSACFLVKSQQRLCGEQIQGHSRVSLAVRGVGREASLLCCTSSPLPSRCLGEKTCCSLLAMTLNEHMLHLSSRAHFLAFGGLCSEYLMLSTEAKGLQPPLCQMRSVSCTGGLKLRNTSSRCLSDGPAFFDVPILRSLFSLSHLCSVSRGF